MKQVEVARTGSLVLERQGYGKGEQTYYKTINAAKRHVRAVAKKHDSKAVAIAKDNAVQRFAAQLASEKP